MKLPILLLTALASGVLFLTPAQGEIIPASELVRIDVRVQSDQDRKDIAKTTTDTVTQHKTLNITLSGKAKSPETRTGKWTVYARDLKGKDITALESSDFKVDFSGGAQTVESKKVSTTYTPEHSTVSSSRSRSGGSSRSSTKKTPGTGAKYIGFGVVVTDGGKTVGEYFDPAGLKAEIAK